MGLTSRATHARLAVWGIALYFAAPGPVHAGDPPASTAATAQATASAAPADPAREKRERQARALELHDEAKALYERGLYRRAIAKLEAALELDPAGKELVYNLALIHEKLVETDEAEKYYRRYIDIETDPKARARAEAIVKRLEAAKKNLKDDLQERAAASSTASTTAPTVGPAPTVSPVSRRPSPMVLVLGGVALAAAGVGAGFGASALSAHPDGASTGRGTTSYDLEARAQSAHNQAIVADLAFATSLVVGAATAVLYLLETRSSRPASPLPPRSAQVRWEVPF